MANRVLWLLANRHRASRPRCSASPSRARRRANWRAHPGAHRAARRGRTHAATGTTRSTLPTVATYNSFANSLYRDNAMLLGREGDGTVLGDGGRVAARALGRDRAAPTTACPSSARASTRSPRRRPARSPAALAENVGRRASAVRKLAREFAEVAELPTGSTRRTRGRGRPRADDRRARRARSTSAADYDAAKVRRGVVEYSDQVALALQIAAAAARDRRGAARPVPGRAARRVPGHLGRADRAARRAVPRAPGHGGRRPEPVDLRMARRERREPRAVRRAGSDAGETRFVALDQLAQRHAHPRRRERASSSRSPPDRGVGSTEADARRRARASCRSSVVFAETVARRGRRGGRLARRARAAATAREPNSAALLLRARKTQPFFLAALREHGVPFHVLGVGGLLQRARDRRPGERAVGRARSGAPASSCSACSPGHAGGSACTTCTRCSRLASWLRDARHDAAAARRRRAGDDARERRRGRGRLDRRRPRLPRPRAQHPRACSSTFSDVGARAAAGRRRARSPGCGRAPGSTCPTSSPSSRRSCGSTSRSRANERRCSATREPRGALRRARPATSPIADVATLGGFLAWLREAEQRDDLSPRPEDPEPGTRAGAHHPRLQGARVGRRRGAAAASPTSCRRSPLEGFRGWLSFGQFPWPLPRRRRPSCREFDWRVRPRPARSCSTIERRSACACANAASTRSAGSPTSRSPAPGTTLLLSASFWATQTSAAQAERVPARARAGGLRAARCRVAPESEENPLGDDLDAVHLAARSARRAPARRSSGRPERSATAEPALAGPWTRDLELLLAEREAPAQRRRRRADADPRVRHRASRTTSTDPAAVAGDAAPPDARAAVPRDPARHPLPLLGRGALRRSARGSDELDALPRRARRRGTTRVDDEAARAAAGASSRRSQWAPRRPVEVEREIHLPFDGPDRRLQDRRRVLSTRAVATRSSTGRPARRREGRRRPRSASSCSSRSTASPTRSGRASTPRSHRRGLLLRRRRPRHPTRRTSTPKSELLARWRTSVG